MKRLVNVLIFLIFIALTNTFSQTDYSLLHELNVHNLSTNVHQSCLKIYAVAVNSHTQQAYISGILTSNIAVVDLNTRQVIGNITLPKSDYTIMALLCDAPANRLYGYTQTEGGAEPTNLYAIDLTTKTIADSFNFHTTICAVVVDTLRHRLYFTFRTRELIDMNGLDFADHQTRNLAFPLHGGHLSTNSDTLYIASGNVSNMAHVSLYHLPDFSHIREMDIPHPDTSGLLGSVTAIPELNRLALDGLFKLRITDWAGNTIAFHDWGGDYSTTGTHGPYYDPLSQLLFLDHKAGYESQGEGGRFGKLLVIDPVTGQAYHSRVGLSPSWLALSPDPHLLIINHMAEGNVWLIDLDSMSFEGDSVLFDPPTVVDVATSVEQLSYDPASNELYLSNRLGNNSLGVVDFDTQQYEDFSAGNWPFNISVDPHQPRLYCYSHFESTFYVFTLPDRENPQKIRVTEIPEGRTDMLPNGVLDTFSQRMYVAVPEAAAIAVLNTATLETPPPIPIPGLIADDTYKGVHSLQLACSSTPNRLYCMDQVAMKLYIYDRDNQNTLLETADMSTKVQKASLKGNWRTFSFVQEAGLLAAANHLLDPISIDVVQSITEVNAFVSASSDGETLYYVRFSADNTVWLYEIDPVSYTIREKTLLYSDSFNEPTVLHIPEKGWMVFGDLISTTIRIYDLEEETLVDPSECSRAHPLKFHMSQNYPNPFNPKTKIEFDLPEVTEVTIQIYNINGRKIAVPLHQRLATGHHTVIWDASRFPSGNYFILLEAGEFVQMRKSVLLK